MLIVVHGFYLYLLHCLCGERRDVYCARLFVICFRQLPEKSERERDLDDDGEAMFMFSFFSVVAEKIVCCLFVFSSQFSIPPIARLIQLKTYIDYEEAKNKIKIKFHCQL